ncbi:peptidoglycan DD-metalloendopeptidase family protein [Candidatus Poribacteria bacterium]|nr:peptidoglycan DD-metalloendopeptidase family protein [Candidatus Poribacteria bacterium]
MVSLFILLFGVWTDRAFAEWPSDPTVNVPISTAAYNQQYPQLVSDGAGGALIAWADLRSGADIYTQRVNASGTVLWTIDGIPICTAENTQQNPQLVSDGTGGAIITWEDYRLGSFAMLGDIYAQWVNASGATLWTTNGVPICTAANEQVVSTLVSDGAGGTFITWQDKRKDNKDIYAQRINPSGTVSWIVDGVPLCTEGNWQENPQLASDGAGGAIITWEDNRSDNRDIYAQRVNASGIVLWTTDGITICTAAKTQVVPALVSDGAGGAIIAWYDYRSDNDSDIYAQNVNPDGTLGGISGGGAPPDTTPPTILAIHPPDGTTNVPVEINYTIEFSEPMNQQSVRNTKVMLKDLTTGESWNATSIQSMVDLGLIEANFNPDGTILTFTSSSIALAHNHTYQILLTDIQARDLAGNLLQTNQTLFTFTTILPPPELAIAVSNLTSWVNNSQTFPVTLTNIGEIPLNFTSIQVTGVNWISPLSSLTTLAPGATQQFWFALNVPSNAIGGAFPNPVVYPLKFQSQIADGTTFNRDFNLQLLDSPVALVDIQVVDQTNGAPLANALVMIEGNDTLWGTASNGHLIDPSGQPANILTTPGTKQVSAFKPGYLPRTESLTLSALENHISIALEPGQVFSVGAVETKPLTEQEIIDAGVNLDDPQNNWVYEFKVTLQLDTLNLPPVILPKIEPGSGPSAPKPGDYTLPPATTKIGDQDYRVVSSVQIRETNTVYNFLFIPGEIKLLKELFEIIAVMRNEAVGAEFVITDVQSTLSIPSGLALPNLEGSPQSPTIPIGTIPAAGEVRATWVVRGDAEGTHTVNVSATGMLQPFGAPLVASNSGSVKVFGKPSLDVIFFAPAAVVKNQAFTFAMNIKNTSPIPVYNVTTTLFIDDFINVRLASGEQATKTVGTIQPSETKPASYQLVAEITGSVNLPNSTVTTDPAITPHLSLVPIASQLPLTLTGVEPSPRAPGDLWTLKVDFANNSALPLTNASIRVPIPQHTTYEPNSATSGGILSGGEVVWSLAQSAAATAIGQRSFQVRIADDVAHGTEIQAQARFSADELLAEIESDVMTMQIVDQISTTGFILPVIDDDLTDNLTWDVPFNYFGHYYEALGGYHPGEDWNLVGGDPNADLGKPVYAIADGTVVKVSNLGSLGYLVALQHTGNFTIPGKSATENGQSYSYNTEVVNSIYSVYLHINNVTVTEGNNVEQGTVLGTIMDSGNGPYLHFEIRHPNAVNSNNWSLVGSPSNWAKDANGDPTGYYLNLQEMVDAGVRDPRDFIAANQGISIDLAILAEEVEIGNFEIPYETNSLQIRPIIHNLSSENASNVSVQFSYIDTGGIQHTIDSKLIASLNAGDQIKVGPVTWESIPRVIENYQFVVEVSSSETDSNPQNNRVSIPISVYWCRFFADSGHPPVLWADNRGVESRGIPLPFPQPRDPYTRSLRSDTLSLRVWSYRLW